MLRPEARFAFPPHLARLRVFLCFPFPPARGQAATEALETGHSISLQQSSPPEELRDIFGGRTP